MRAVAGHRQRAPRRRRAGGSWTGAGPTGEIARTHSAPARKLAKRTPAERRCAGRGCTRTHASVITPSVPSEPASMRSGLTPAPEPGSRRDSHTPGGRDRAHRLDEVLDVRPQRREVAAGARGDPAAERGVLERLREVAQRQPVLAQLRLERGPVAPAWMQRGARDLVDLEHAVERAQVDRDGAVVARPHVRASRRPRPRCRRRRGSRRRARPSTTRARARARARRAGARRSRVGARTGRESRCTTSA